jgi:hypothetical protein
MHQWERNILSDLLQVVSIPPPRNPCDIKSLKSYADEVSEVLSELYWLLVELGGGDKDEVRFRLDNLREVRKRYAEDY